VAVIWHGENAPLGRLAEVLDAHQLTWNTVHAGNPESFPDPAEVTGAILIGSAEPTGASRPESTGAEIDWLRRAKSGSHGVAYATVVKRRLNPRFALLRMSYP
jgi:hypothetical protein